jgi:peroxiredoxin
MIEKMTITTEERMKSFLLLGMMGSLPRKGCSINLSDRIEKRKIIRIIPVISRGVSSLNIRYFEKTISGQCQR